MIRLCSEHEVLAVTPLDDGDASSTFLAPTKLLEFESALFEHDAAGTTRL